MRMFGAGIDAQIAELHAAERSARQHALDRFLDDAFWKTALENRLGRALLNPADKTGVAVVDFLLAFSPAEHHFGGVDDDDVVTVVDVRGVSGLVLAAQPHG